jgi:hypothetical protein
MAAMNAIPPRDGATYDHEQDGPRLFQQAADVWSAMHDGRWYSLQALHEMTGYPTQSISARIRDFRKKRFGAHIVDKKRHGLYRGTWFYRLVPNERRDDGTTLA